MRKGALIEYDGLSLSSIEWSAVFAGTFFALSVGLLMVLLGVLIGVGPNPNRSFGFTGISLLTGVWSLITAFVSFYCGGWLSARLCGSPIAGDGRTHGVVTWAFGTVVAVVLLGINARFIGLLLSSMMHQPLLTSGTVNSIVGAGTVWMFVAVLCGLIGGIIGGQVGGPRMIALSQNGEESRPSRAA